LRLWHGGPLETERHLILLHGLEGSARSPSMQALATAAIGKQYAVTIMEFRGCGGGPLNRAPRLYHSGETTDFDHTLRVLRRRHPSRRFHAVGTSLGGNVLGRWLGLHGSNAPLAGAALLSAPYDLAACAPCVDRSLGGFYCRVFLKTLLPKALAKARQHPGLLPIDRIPKIRSIVEYDDLVTAPLHGFRDAADYYARCASGPLLDQIRVPTLLLSSLDDPLVPGSTFPSEVAARSGWLYPEATRRGGHLGFVGSDGRPWYPERILAFFSNL
jgi:predicted alpha/beta-fold hydrolase